MSERRVPDRSRTRRLLPALLGTAALGAAMAAGACAPGRSTPSTDRPAPSVAQHADSLREPLVVRSVNGVLSATLDVTFADLPVTRAGKAIVGDTVSVTDSMQVDTLPLRAYTLAATTDPAYRPGDPRFTPRFPGPTFRVRPGDLVQIWLRNKLPRPTTPDDSNDVCMTYPAAEPGASPRDVYQDCF
ncbi:MAG TPA: hypothetical protein VF263_06265, partial [Longimicrobiaceae bacterium]